MPYYGFGIMPPDKTGKKRKEKKILLIIKSSTAAVIMNIYVASDVEKGLGRLIIQGEKKPLDKQQRLMKDSTAESDKTRTEIDG